MSNSSQSSKYTNCTSQLHLCLPDFHFGQLLTGCWSALLLLKLSEFSKDVLCKQTKASNTLIRVLIVWWCLIKNTQFQWVGGKDMYPEYYTKYPWIDNTRMPDETVTKRVKINLLQLHSLNEKVIPSQKYIADPPLVFPQIEYCPSCTVVQQL